MRMDSLALMMACIAASVVVFLTAMAIIAGDRPLTETRPERCAEHTGGEVAACIEDAARK